MKPIPDELLEQLLEDYEKPEDLLGSEGLLASLQKAVMERALEAELTAHLGYERHAPAGRGSGNSRNGHGRKTVLTDRNEVELDVPRDRNGSFAPQLVKKRQTRLPGFDRQVIALYARGVSQRDVRAHLEEMYGVSVSPELISRVTDAVVEELQDWQKRPLDAVYPVVFLDAIRVRIRDEGLVRNKAVHIALGIRQDGSKEVLGLWIEQNEGAKFWLRVMNELRGRGLRDILIAVVDGLKGFPEAIRSVFPEAQVQTCVVHLMRHGLHLCSWKDRRRMASDMKTIYRAGSVEEAADRLDEFERTWGGSHPSVVRSWRANWEELIPMFGFAPEVRRLLYTTNAIESLNRGLRKAVKTRGHFPNDQAAAKLLYLAIRNIERKWKAAPTHWRQALNQLDILCGDRLQRVS